MSEPRLYLALARASDIKTSALRFLDGPERQRIRKMQSQQRRDEFAGGRALAKHLLERVTGRPPSSHVIRLAESGRPGCEPGLDLSIAHSAGLLACAVAREATVGVDIERPEPGRNTERISRAYFTSEEADWLAGEPAESFYRLWVLKEAWLKARGSGLAGGLDRLSVRFDGAHIDARIDGAEAGTLLLFEWQDVPIGLAAGSTDSAPAVLEWSGERAALEHTDLRPTGWTVAG
ncbi:MAG: 4'-phosphopantetheinyl transferase superfamily protein [Pseudomonadota bacterium]